MRYRPQTDAAAEIIAWRDTCIDAIISRVELAVHIRAIYLMKATNHDDGASASSSSATQAMDDASFARSTCEGWYLETSSREL